MYRSAELNHLHDADLAAFAQLGIHTVYDLRTAAEIEAEPDRLPPGTDTVVLDVLADSADTAPAALKRLVTDPGYAERLLGGGKAEAIFATAYREIVSLPSALAAYRQLYSGLADPARRPALYHCTTGKDRTGWATVALLLFLGVPEEQVREEYLLTNDELLPALQPVLDQFQLAGGDPDLLLPVLGVRPGYLAAALDEMRGRFGTIEGYFAHGLDLPPEVRTALRNALIDFDHP